MSSVHWFQLAIARRREEFPPGVWSQVPHNCEVRLHPFSSSILAVTTWRHRGARVIFSVALTCHDLLHWVVWVNEGLSKDCLSTCGSTGRVTWGLQPISCSGNTVNAARSADMLLHALGALHLPANDNFTRSKFISAPVLSRKLVSSRPSASVGSGHTKNVWSNFRPPRTKEACCWPHV